MSIWVAAHPYLSLLALLLLAGSVLAFLFHRSDKHARDSQPAVGRATVVQKPDVARHRAGAVKEVWKDHTPLPAWERLRLSPTHNDPDVFVPQADLDPERLGETRPLVAPKRRPDMRQTLRHLAANENATEAERALAQGLLNVHEKEATQ